MFFNNYQIFIYISLFVIAFGLVRYFTKLRLVRNLVLSFANLIVLLFFVKEHSLIVISVLSLLVFVAGQLLQRRNLNWLLYFMVSLMIVLFSIRNYPYVQQLLEQSYFSFVNTPILSVQKVGLSYILFRYVHWLVESSKRTIHQSDFLTFLSYIFFFPTFLAGPIDQYNNFHYWLGNARFIYNRSLFFAGVMRAFIGAVKTLGVVPFVIDYATDYNLLLPYFSPAMAVFVGALFYSLYIYFDFSGYSDIAIGTAYMLGIKIPENFNNPYFSDSLREFWRRWHITFSLFLRLYVFKPFINLYNRIINPRHRLLVSIISYLSTFLVCGLWHGETINFAWWGLWHGVGLSINKLWTVKVVEKSSFGSSFWYRMVSILVTFIYVSIGWIFFHYKANELGKIFELIS